MSNKKNKGGCTVCYDCGWVLNDDFKTPFYDTTFAALEPGDELIRCWECNSIDMQPVASAKKQKKQTGFRYKTH